MQPLKPHALIPDPDTMPQELKPLAQWVVWRYAPNDNRDAWTKTPLQAQAAMNEKGYNASSTRPQTWADFATAKKAYAVNPPSAGDIPIPENPNDDPGHNGVDGVGFILTPENSITGVDLDHCLDAEGNPSAWAEPILERFAGTYREVSPSGTGLRIFCYGKKPSPEHSKVGDVEMYDGRSKNGKQGGRYLTLTGHSYGDPEPITEKQDAVTWLYETYLVKPKAKMQEARQAGANNPGFLPVSDSELLKRMFASAKGSGIKALWEGDNSAYVTDKRDGESEGDLALAAYLAWWCDYDLARADALFRQSNRMRPKWDADRGEQSYGQLTLKTASEGKGPGDGYRPDSAEPLEWEKPHALPSATPDVPTMPAEMIPKPLRPWIDDVAERLCVHREYIAIPALVSLGAVIGRTVGIHPKQFDDWLEVANVWGGLVGPPSSKKSPAIAEASAPLERLAARAAEAHTNAQAERGADAEIIKLELLAIKRKAQATNAKAADFRDELQTKLSELEENDIPERRYLTNDGTIEKIAELLKATPRGLLVKRDELIGLLRTCDKSGHETDRAFYLEAWNGKGRHTIDRVGKGTFHIPALTLALLGGIQPGPLATYVRGAIEGEGGADGLLQRFQLLVWPDRQRRYVNIDRYADTAAKNRAFEIFEFLDLKTGEELGAKKDELNPDSIPALRFSPDAQHLFNGWLESLMGRLLSPELEATPAFHAHLSKYPSLMPSLALVFHLVDVADGRASGPVSADAADLAAAWCDFLELHARKLYALELNRDAVSAHALAERIIEGEVHDTQNVSDLYRRRWPGLVTAAEVGAALSTLEVCHWLQVEELPNPGARPTKRIRINPQVTGA